jgi:hypothetical protein
MKPELAAAISRLTSVAARQGGRSALSWSMAQLPRLKRRGWGIAGTPQLPQLIRFDRGPGPPDVLTFLPPVRGSHPTSPGAIESGRRRRTPHFAAVVERLVRSVPAAGVGLAAAHPARTLRPLLPNQLGMPRKSGIGSIFAGAAARRPTGAGELLRVAGADRVRASLALPAGLPERQSSGGQGRLDRLEAQLDRLGLELLAKIGAGFDDVRALVAKPADALKQEADPAASSELVAWCAAMAAARSQKVAAARRSTAASGPVRSLASESGESACRS